LDCSALKVAAPDPWQGVSHDKCTMAHLRKCDCATLEEDLAPDKAYAAKSHTSNGFRPASGANWRGLRRRDTVNDFSLPALKEAAKRAGALPVVIQKIARPIDGNISVLLRKGPV
jgi:hypothetical protein